MKTLRGLLFAGAIAGYASAQPSSLHSLPHSGGPGWVWTPPVKQTDVIVFLHGINSKHLQRVNIQGKRSLEHVAQDMVLVEMTDDTDLLYGEDFHPGKYMSEVRALLKERSIGVNSIGVIAFSGANCRKAVHTFVKEVHPEYVFLVDGTCDTDYAKGLADESNPTIALYTRGYFKGDHSSAKTLLKKPGKFRCPFKSCMRDGKHAVYFMQEKDHDKTLDTAFAHIVETYYKR